MRGAKLLFESMIPSRDYVSETIYCDYGFFNNVFVSIFDFIIKRDRISFEYPLLRTESQKAVFLTFDFQRMGIQCFRIAPVVCVKLCKKGDRVFG